MADSAGSERAVGTAGLRLAPQSVRRELQEALSSAQGRDARVLHTQEKGSVAAGDVGIEQHTRVPVLSEYRAAANLESPHVRL